MNAPILQFYNDPFYTCLNQVGIPPQFRDRFDDDAEDNLQAHLSASAPSTIYGFRSDVIRWIARCNISEADPLAPRPRDVRDFIRDYEHGRKPSTVKRMVANIGVLTSGILGNKNVCQTKVVRAEMKRLRRERGSQHKQALAIRQLGAVTSMEDPALPFSIERMLEVLEPDRSLFALRGKLLMSLGGDTGRRNSEYRLANFSHLQTQADGSGTFHVDRSKTDQDGNGLVRFTSRRTMRYLEEWRTAREATGEIVNGNSPLLVGLSCHHRVGKRLCHVGYHIALRWAVRKALTILSGDHPELLLQIDHILTRISGHSFRVGMVEDLITAGETIAAICIEGGWETSTMPLLYGRNIDARKGACARLRGKLGDE
jgi:integrase